MGLWVARSGGTGWRGLEQASTPGSARLEFGKTNLNFLENRFVVIFRCTGDCIAVRHCAKYMVGPFCQLDFLFSVCDHCQSIVIALLYSALNHELLSETAAFDEDCDGENEAEH